MSKLTMIARQILAINDDLPYRVKNPTHRFQENFELYSFDQLWGSTALGF